MTLFDQHRRPMQSLRLSVTDRCNLRCVYCMPEAEYTWLPKPSILAFEELARLASLFARLGANEIRLTGGEPLLRQDLPVLVDMLARVPGIRDLALTTNALELPKHAAALAAAGLHRLTISLDTLNGERFARLTGRDRLADTLAGIDAAAAAGFTRTKLNTVVMRGVNDDEIVPLVRFAAERGLEVRFIEYMDVGGATRWSRAEVFGRDEILAVLRRAFGELSALPNGNAPAERWELPDGTRVGVIASMTAPFCRSCDRSRLTADGMWLLCLYARDGIDLRGLLRGGASDEAILDVIERAWQVRTDRGAETRRDLLQIGELRRDPHLEMHTRGG
jgi:GTP 3',8-cyclase